MIKKPQFNRKVVFLALLCIIQFNVRANDARLLNSSKSSVLSLVSVAVNPMVKSISGKSGIRLLITLGDGPIPCPIKISL